MTLNIYLDSDFMSFSPIQQQNEYVILVDKNNKEIGTQEKIKAHELAQCHRAFSVFIYRLNSDTQEIEVLLQQREQNKYHCGGLWTNTCCGHPRPGEETVQAGQRRLFEEMGIEHNKLELISQFHYVAEFSNGLTENEMDHVLIGKFAQSQNQSIHLNPVEASDARWITFDALETELDKSPEDFTPWLAQALQQVKSHLLSLNA